MRRRLCRQAASSRRCVKLRRVWGSWGRQPLACPGGQLAAERCGQQELPRHLRRLVAAVCAPAACTACLRPNSLVSAKQLVCAVASDGAGVAARRRLAQRPADCRRGGGGGQVSAAWEPALGSRALRASQLLAGSKHVTPSCAEQGTHLPRRCAGSWGRSSAAPARRPAARPAPPPGSAPAQSASPAPPPPPPGGYGVQQQTRLRSETEESRTAAHGSMQRH